MAVDQNLLNLLIGKDPLYNMYQDEGLLTNENISPYSKDWRWEYLEPGSLEKQKQATYGYTYPSKDTETNLYINELEKFGEVPKGPLHATREEVGFAGNIIEANPKDDLFGKPVGVDKFGNTQYAPMTWRDFYTEHGNLEGLYSGPTIAEKNKQIAETIGHEARHQLLGQNPEFYEDIDDDLVANIGATRTSKHELLNRMLDFQSYNDPRIYKNIYEQMHGGMPRHLSSPIANKFSNQAAAFLHKMRARGGGGADVMPVPPVQRGGDAGVAEAIAAQDRAEKKAAIQEAVSRQIGTSRGDGGGQRGQRGSAPTGTAGRTPWGRADGGLIDFYRYGGFVG